jgi:hypothetical protein
MIVFFPEQGAHGWSHESTVAWGLRSGIRGKP